MAKYMIKIDDDYLVGFNGKYYFGNPSNEQNQSTTESKTIELSMYERRVFQDELDLKRALDKLFEIMEYSGFSFDHLEIFCYEDV